MLSEKDNVATALRDLAAGQEVVVGTGERAFTLAAAQAIAFGHKLAVAEIRPGDEVIKYGEVIGRATQRIPAGAHAHVHNIGSLRGRGDLEAGAQAHGV